MDQQEMIDSLRLLFGEIKTMDPAGAPYKRLCKILDNADDEALKAVYEAKIPFASLLAFNRMHRRGIK